MFHFYFLAGLKDDICSNTEGSDLKCAPIINLSCDDKRGSCQCDFPYVWNPTNKDCIDLEKDYYKKDEQISKINYSYKINSFSSNKCFFSDALFFLIPATSKVCNDESCPIVCKPPKINCDSDKGLTCNSNHCECTSPYEWNAETKSCDICASGYEKVDESGKEICGNLKKKNIFLRRN
jgi:hypothetical protein